MIRAGDRITFNRGGGTIGAIIPKRNSLVGVTAAHIFAGHTGTITDKKGLYLGVEGQKCKVIGFLKEFDLAYFKVTNGEATSMDDPKMGDAAIVSSYGIRTCRISDVSWSLCMVVLNPGNLPGPGESGAPLVQNGNVVGIISSINLNTCKGTVVSSSVIQKGIDVSDWG